MRLIVRAVVAVIVFTFTMSPVGALAAGPAQATFGTSWDGPSSSLQTIVDNYLGAPGLLNVTSDYVGAHAGDLDPWFWVGHSVPALLITEVAGNASTNELGWYLETGSLPVLDGVNDGVVFAGSQGDGANTVVVFPSDMTKFGFYLNIHHDITTPQGRVNQVFYTNRRFNDPGPYGFGATHAPWDGDIQAIVFDVSQWKGSNTWLVCFEDLDAGLTLGTQTDNDYNDFVFQVTALGATPASTLSFGALKARYR